MHPARGDLLSGWVGGTLPLHLLLRTPCILLAGRGAQSPLHGCRGAGRVRAGGLCCAGLCLSFGVLAGGLRWLLAVLWVLPGVLWLWLSLWLSPRWWPCWGPWSVRAAPAPQQQQQQQRCVSSSAAAASIAAGNAPLL